MYEDFLKLPVDNTLTIHTAYERGYKWVFDIGAETPQDIQQDFVRMVKEEGYKLGKPRFWRLAEGAEKDKGLYKPLQKTIQQSKGLTNRNESKKLQIK